jgi:hypothetical protein
VEERFEGVLLDGAGIAGQSVEVDQPVAVAEESTIFEQFQTRTGVGLEGFVLRATLGSARIPILHESQLLRSWGLE